MKTQPLRYDLKKFFLSTIIFVLFMLLQHIQLYAQVANAGEDKTLCSATFTLEGNQPNAGNSGFWQLLSGQGTITTPTLYNSTVTNLGIMNTNVFRWAITDGATTTYDEVNLINAAFTVFAGFDQTICSYSYNLSATNSGGTGTWTVLQGNGNFVNSNLYNTQVNNLAQGINRFQWEVTKNTCTFADEVVITNDIPTLSNAGAQQTICENNTTLTGNNPTVGSGMWTVVSGFATITTPTLYNSTVTGLGQGTNTLKWKITMNDCFSETTVSIISNYFTPFAGIDGEVCAFTTSLQALPPAPGTGVWSVENGGNAIVTTPTLNTSGVTNLDYGVNTFKWAVTQNNCTNYDYVVITNNSPTPANAGADETICENFYTLNGNLPTIGTGRWYVSSGGGTFANATLHNTMITQMGYNLNTYAWKITRGSCESIDYVRITNHKANPVAGNNQSICASSSLLMAQNPAPWAGRWELISGSGSIVSPSSFMSVVDNLSIGANEFKWTTIEASGCTDSDNVIITNRLVPAEAGPTQTICGNTTLQGNNPAPGAGLWVLVGGQGTIANATLPNSQISIDVTGVSTVRWIITHDNCTSIDSVFIVNNQVPPKAGLDRNVCGNTNLQGEAAIAGSGTWTTTGNATIAQVHNPTSNVYNLDYGVNSFTWTITNLNCTSSDEVILTNYEFQIEAGDNQNICQPQTYLDADAAGADGYGVWSIIGGNGTFAEITQHNTIVTNISEGVNQFRWTVLRNGCSDIDDVFITNNQFDVFAGIDKLICTSETVLNSELPENATGIWDIIEGGASVTNPTAYNSSVINLSAAPQTNLLRWYVTQNNCTFFDDMAITYNPLPPAYAGEDQETCQNYITLDAQPATLGVGHWALASGTGSVQSLYNPNSEVINLGFGINEFAWVIDYLSCQAKDTVAILSALFEANAGENQTVCSFSATLTGDNPYPGTGLWQVVEGAGDFVHPEYFTTQVDNMGYGANIYSWTMFIGSCIDDDFVIITNNMPTLAEAGPSEIICSETYVMQGNQPEIGTGVWTLVSGSATIAQPANYNTPVFNLGLNQNTFKWKTTNMGCVSEDFVVITNNLIESFAGNEQTVCANATAVNASPPTPGSGAWTIVTGTGVFQNILGYNSIVTGLAQGLNTFRWTVNYMDCSDYSDVNITNNEPTFAVAGTDQLISINNTSLSANTPIYGVGAWTKIGGTGTITTPNSPETTVTNMSFGDNTFRWTITNFNCSYYDDVLIKRVVGVWPGDTDNNLEATHYDLLPIGIGYLKQGPPRGSISIAWQQHPAMDWVYSLNSGVNLKFADCNGDGIINSTDALAIDANFGYTHPAPSKTITDEPDFYTTVEWLTEEPNDNVYKAELIMYPTLPENKIYGLGLEVKIHNANNINLAQSSVHFNNSWMNPSSLNFISVVSMNEGDTIIYIGMTRTNFTDLTGNGNIANLNLKFNDVADTAAIEFEITSEGGVKFNETPVTIEQFIDGDIGIEPENFISQNVTIYPNPTSEQLFFEVPLSGEYILNVYNLNGQAMLQTQKSGSKGWVNIQNLPQGLYIIELKNTTSLFRSRFTVIH